MPRYYPRSRSIFLAPVAFGSIMGIPFIKRSSSRELGILVFLAVFAVTFALWRWFLSVRVADGKLHGRHPEALGYTVLELSAITRVERGKFMLGRVDGWVFQALPGEAVFVSDPALADPELRAVFDRHAQPSSSSE